MREGFCPQAGFQVDIRVGCLRRLATNVLDEWSYTCASRGQNPAYRPTDNFISCGNFMLVQQAAKLVVAEVKTAGGVFLVEIISAQGLFQQGNFEISD